MSSYRPYILHKFTLIFVNLSSRLVLLVCIFLLLESLKCGCFAKLFGYLEDLFVTIKDLVWELRGKRRREYIRVKSLQICVKHERSEFSCESI